MKILYIMGRGHSGSTIIDIALGSNQYTFSTGELISGMSKLQHNKCSCSESILDCSLWKDVVVEYEETTCRCFLDDMKVFTSFFHLKNLPRVILLNKKNVKIKDIVKIQNELFNAISKVTKKDVIVDSSKEITRGIFLVKLIPEAKVVHLIRQPLEVYKSTYKRFVNNEKLKFLRVKFKPSKLGFVLYTIVLSLSWSISYFISLIVLVFGKDNYHQLDYLDFIENNKRAVEKISEFIGNDFSDVSVRIENNDDLNITHNLGGNRIAQNSKIKLIKNHHQTKIPVLFSCINSLLTYPIWYLNKFISSRFYR